MKRKDADVNHRPENYRPIFADSLPKSEYRSARSGQLCVATHN